MLERTVDRVALRRAQFLEVFVDPFARRIVAQVLDDFLARQNGFGNVVHTTGI